MGMDLHGRGSYHHFNMTSWRYVLGLAHSYGWQPAGTEPPSMTVYYVDGTVDERLTAQYAELAEDWNRYDYFTNSFQQVTDEDAANLADALERALTDVPEERTVAMRAASQPPHRGVPLDVVEHLTPLDWFSGERERLEEFISYCRAGGFRIS